MTSRYLTKTSGLSALALVLGLGLPAIAAPATGSTSGYASSKSAPASRNVNVLHAFSGIDGSAPEGNLDLALGYRGGSITRALYGITEGGGASASGTIFSYVLGSNVFRSLYSFTGGNDGSIPVEGLANNETNYFIGAQTQFGVTISGGADNEGVLYAVGANGQPVVVHTFTGGTDGGNPSARLTRFTDGSYYGTTSNGALGYGTVFRVTSSGQFSTLYSFTGGADGGSPQAGLTILVNLHGHAVAPAGTPAMAVEQMATSSRQYVSPYLYGTTSTAGADGVGTIFRITPAGNVQTVYTFTGGLDGGVPEARLTSDFSGNLYGSASVGGSAGNGVIFKLPFNSATPRILHDFGNGATGAAPAAQLTLAFNGNLYGTATQGGANGDGTVFEITPSGLFGDIHDFAVTDGQTPQGGLVDGGDGKLYGTTTNGGAASSGVLFSIQE